MKPVLHLLFVFLLLLNHSEVSAQHPGLLKFDHLTTSEGLSQNSVLSILHDSEGYMWFGTLDGLNKYNGYEFVTYKHDPRDPNSLSNDDIHYLYEDSQDNLWVGTNGGGLNLYNRDGDNFTRYNGDTEEHHTLGSNSVTVMLEDSRGSFWVGTSYGLGLMDRDLGMFITFYDDPDDAESIKGNHIYDLYEDSRGNLWVGTGNGLNLINRENKTFTHFLHNPEDPTTISSNRVTRILEDRNGRLWVGTRDGGINYFDYEEDRFYSYMRNLDDPYSISDNTVIDLYEDHQGVLWIAVENQGLDIFNTNENRFYNYRNRSGDTTSLNNDSVNIIYESRDRILWIGTWVGGVNFIDRKSTGFLHYTQNPYSPNSLNNNTVRSFLEDSKGNFWVGTDGGGLNLFDRENEKFVEYRNDPRDLNSIPSDVILAMEEEKEGDLWLGSYGGGVSLFDVENHTFTHFKATNKAGSENLNDNDVFALHKDPQGLLWIGTNSGGINLLDPETGEVTYYVEVTEDEYSIDNNSIRAIYEDSRNNIWIGSYGTLLTHFDRKSGKFQTFDVNRDHLFSSVILGIHEDRKDRLWLATRGGGLKLFDRDTKKVVASYTMEEGLPSNILYGIVEDDHGSLWLSTNNGISNFFPETETFINYNTAHGVQDPEFGPGAYYKDSTGYIYFGGANGFNRFHPDSIRIEAEVSPIVLTDFQIFNNSIKSGVDSPLDKHISRAELILLPYTASVFTFSFATLDFHKNKDNRFAYKMEGFDNDWNYVDQRRSATYTNLNPGEYQFRVRTVNKDGIWSESDASVALVIIPPFWQTSWFYLLCLLFVAGALGGGMRWREKSITEQNKRLEKEVARQTSELFDKNSELRSTLEELKDARSELVEKAHKAGMADLATNVLHNVGNILNSVNVSASMIDETLKKSKLQSLKQANQLIKENADDLENFILNDPRGQKLLHYYVKLEEPLNREHETLSIHNLRLTENIKLMIDVVSAQQSYSTAGRIIEHLSLEELIEDTLVLQSASFERHNLDLVTDYQKVTDIYVEKTKVVHILVNLLKNAKESMSELEPGKKMIALKTFQDEEYVYLSIMDNGCGIPEGELKKVFTHGYTTKSYGHGFGLHSCANYMNELKGEIRVESEGPGKGTTFTLCFPRRIEKVKELMKTNPVTKLADTELK